MKIYFNTDNLSAARKYLIEKGASTADNFPQYLESRIRALLNEASSANDFYVVYRGCGFFLGPSQLEQKNSMSIDVKTDRFKQVNGEPTAFTSIDFWLYA